MSETTHKGLLLLFDPYATPLSHQSSVAGERILFNRHSIYHRLTLTDLLIKMSKIIEEKRQAAVQDRLSGICGH